MNGKIFKAVAENVGIIKYVMDGLITPEDIAVHSMATAMADTSVYFLHTCNQRNGGAGWTTEQALISTIGEGIERYCLSFYDKNKLLLAPWQEIKHSAIHPSKFPKFSEQQYDLFVRKGITIKPFDENTLVAWTEGVELITGEKTYVPAQFVYIPYALQEGEVQVLTSISTGAAFGENIKDVILYGLLENIERDALSIWWHRKVICPTISNSSIRKLWPGFEEYQKKFLKVWVKLISLDHPIPVVVMIGIKDFLIPSLSRRKKVLMFGSAARLSGIKAIKKCALEIAQASPFYRYLYERKSKKGISVEETWDFDDHALYWIENTEKLFEEVERFLGEGDEIDVRDLPDFHSRWGKDGERVTKWLLEKLNDTGVTPVYVSLTTPDIEELGGVVGKIVVPEFVPLEGAHILRFEGTTRLWEVPEKLNIKCSNELNTLPHPSP